MGRGMADAHPNAHPNAARAMSRCLQIALPIGALDLVSKELATQWRVESLVFNTAARVPVSAGAGVPAWAGDAVIAVCTLALALRVVRALAAIDPKAIVALGLIAGGTLGNLASLLTGPAGVADFLGLPLTPTYGIVANGADLALWSGAVLLLPVARTLVRRLRDHRPVATPRLAQNPM